MPRLLLLSTFPTSLHDLELDHWKTKDLVNTEDRLVQVRLASRSWKKFLKIKKVFAEK